MQIWLFGESERPASAIGESENHSSGIFEKRERTEIYFWREGECAAQNGQRGSAFQKVLLE